MAVGDHDPAARPAHGAGEHGTFDAVNVTEQPRFSRRLLRAAAVSCAGIALAFAAATLLAKGPGGSQGGGEHAREVSLAVQELEGDSGWDPDAPSSFSEPSYGIFTGHTKGRKGTPLTFGKKTFYNVFDPNPYQEECYPGMYGQGGEACRECPAGAWCPGGRQAVLCPAKASSAPGSYEKKACRCKPGYVGDGDACRACPANSYCPGGSQIHQCPPFSFSGEASFECRCAKGYFGARADKCAECPAGFFCEGHRHKEACPKHTDSVAGASDASMCRCVPSFFQLRPADPRTKTPPVCEGCPPDHFCPGGTLAVPCPLNSRSPADSASADACECRAGWYGADAGSCMPCDKGFYCPGGEDAQACPSNSHSPPGSDSLDDCACVPGYVGERAEACAACPAGSYCSGGAMVAKCPVHSTSDEGSSRCACEKGWRGEDPHRCQRCPRDSFCPGEGKQKACPAHTTDPVGMWRERQCRCTPGFHGTGGHDCRTCPAGSFCARVGGVAEPCPPSSSSPAGATRAAQCTCEAGTYNRRGWGRVGALTGPDCVTCPPGRYCVGGGRYQNCPARTTSEPGAKSLMACKCIPGHYGQAPNCARCPAGSYCTGGESPRACPAGSSSPPGATSVLHCKCKPGFFGTEANRCARCPANSYCPGGARVKPCPRNSHSLQGQTQCTCVAGFYGRNAHHCRPCPRNRYCPGGKEVARCPAGAESGWRAKKEKECTCGKGLRHFLDDDDRLTCRPCEAGSYCPGKSRRRSCPDHKTSNPRATSAQQCGCIAGYADAGLVPSSNFAWVYSGALKIVTGGRYVLCVTSDDGSRLFVDDRMVVNNDGLHATRERCGGVSLESGRHKVRAEGFQAGGHVSMWLKYRGPDTKGRTLFTPSVETSPNGHKGWNLKVYAANHFIRRMPDLNKLRFLGEKTLKRVHVPVAGQAGRFRSYIEAKCRKCPAGQWCPGAFPSRARFPRARARRCPGRQWTLSPGASSLAHCTACRPGWYGADWRECRGCPRGSFCTGGKEATACPAGATTYHMHRSSIHHCVCDRGYQRVGGGRRWQCEPCAAGYYCPHFNGLQRRRCPAGSSSPSGAKHVSQCTCPPGKYGGRGHKCYTCQKRYYCPGDGRRKYCHHRATSPPGSAHVSACTCPNLNREFPVVRTREEPKGCSKYHCRTMSKCDMQRWCSRDKDCRGFTFPQGVMRGFTCKVRGLSSCLGERASAPADFFEKAKAKQPLDSVALMRRLRMRVPTCKQSGKAAVLWQHCWPRRARHVWKATLHVGAYPYPHRSRCDNDQDLCSVGQCGLRGGDLSSMDIPDGYAVELYSGVNFKGRKTTLQGPMDADQNCLTKFSMNGRVSWNDRARSVKVIRLRTKQDEARERRAKEEKEKKEKEEKEKKEKEEREKKEKEEREKKEKEEREKKEKEKKEKEEREKKEKEEREKEEKEKEEKEKKEKEKEEKEKEEREKKEKEEKEKKEKEEREKEEKEKEEKEKKEKEEREKEEKEKEEKEEKEKKEKEDTEEKEKKEKEDKEEEEEGKGKEDKKEEPCPPQLCSSSGDSLLNEACAAMRDENLRGRKPGNVDSQKKTMAKCMQQDCVQSMEKTGCRWLDKHNFCYTEAGQAWCEAHSGSAWCVDAHKLLGPAWAPAYTAPIEVFNYKPESWEAGDPYTCSCMKDCSSTSKKTYCVDKNQQPVGPGKDLPVGTPSVLSNKKGQCVCACGAKFP